MSKRFWTADWHLGAAGICTYANRPFKNFEHMNHRIIAEANMRAKIGDTLVHVGDFCNRGKVDGVEGSREKAADYLMRIFAKVILLEGNHDPQNKTKTVGKYLFTNIGKYGVCATHYPLDAMLETDDPLVRTDVHSHEMQTAIAASCDFVLCGHVHQAWKTKVVRVNGKDILNINVGVDQWNYRPVSDNELLHFYESQLVRR